MKSITAFIFLLLLAAPAFGQQILINDDASDWAQIEALYTDGEDSFSPVNFGVLKIDNDDQFLYFYLEVGAEINLQENNNVTLFIDADNKENTGITQDEIGADLEYNLGQRRGSIHRSTSTGINSYAIGLVSAPTVTSTWFEFKIDLNTSLNGVPVFQGETIAVVFTSASGDQIPEKNEVLRYQLRSDKNFVSSPYQIKKPAHSSIRVLSYNVRRDDLFDPNNQPHFERIISTIDPDIIGFQEIYDHSGEQTAALIEDFIPSNEGEQWYSGNTGNDNLIVSRYPIIKQRSIDKNAAFLLDLGDRELLALVAHPPCCSSGDVGRQSEINAMMAFVRNSKSGEGFDIAEGTPIMIMGDMNMVGNAQQQRTLLTGDITNNTTYGPDFSPDWDGSAFEDAKPINPELPTTFTWYSSNSSFSAGRLDYLVYSGSVLELDNSFALYTPALPADTLSKYALEANDSILSSDHLPLVADFSIPVINSSASSHELPTHIKLFQNYPNPFNPSTSISFELIESARISLSIYTLAGRKIVTLSENTVYAPGSHSLLFNANNLASGVYIYQLRVGSEVITKKMVLIK